MKNFFLWCAGSDKYALKHCPNSEEIKHCGIGALVLVPAILAFFSMSYALSTISLLQDNGIVYWGGGLIWALIIFAFDRYIVSSHRKRPSHKEELKNPIFYLRFVFAMILGIVVSHPIVMMYFDGSIEDQIKENIVAEKSRIDSLYNAKIEWEEAKIATVDSNYTAKEGKRDKQALLVAKEIDGDVFEDLQDGKLTTGFAGKGPAAENKIQHLQKLDGELKGLKQEGIQQKQLLQNNISTLRLARDSTILAYTVSYDYLQRELALQQLKKENSIVGMTQFMLMLLLILVDMLPVIFKTFSPFGLYDKMLLDNLLLSPMLNSDGRKKALENNYDFYNSASIIRKE
mgnify:FL=1|tara:strand:+ start:58331 stop:59362 length:1032 start_codon:yes stop_codon:yes gene_type:complete